MEFERELEKQFEYALEVDQKTVEETNPYEFKYQSREILYDIVKKLVKVKDNIMQSTTSNEEMDKELTFVKCSLGKAFYMLGVNFYLAEEQSRGESCLLKAIHLLIFQISPSERSTLNKDSSHKIDDSRNTNENTTTIIDGKDDFPKEIQELGKHYKLNSLLSEEVEIKPRSIDFIDYLTDAFNYLGIIWTNRGENKKAEALFKRAEGLYFIFKENKEALLLNIELAKKMEDMHTMTTYYLAQIYSLDKNESLSSEYCFLTLKRQLDNGLEFNKFEWVNNCLSLSAYFTTLNSFEQALHFLDAARYVLGNNDDVNSDNENFKQTTANTNLTEAQLHLHKLQYSMDWLLKSDSNNVDITDSLFDNSENSIEKMVPVPINPTFETKKHIFENLPEEQVPWCSIHTVCRNYEQALSIFKKSKSCFEKALQYFVLDGYVTEHVETTRLLCKLYKILAFYEKDINRKIAMHERRLKLLDAIVDELNENIFLGTLKQLTYDLGEISSQIFELLSKKANYTHSKKPSFNRLNTASLKTVNYMNRFCGYFCRFKSKTLNIEQLIHEDLNAVDVEEENRITYIRARLLVARMYYNLQGKDISEQSSYLISALREFQYIIKYQHAYRVEDCEEEIAIAKQMSKLLPTRIYDLRRSIV